MKKSEATISFKMLQKAFDGLSVNFFKTEKWTNFEQLRSGQWIQIQYSAENALSIFDKGTWISQWVEAVSV